MTLRTQLKGWLFATSLFVGFSFSPVASAVAPSSSPKAVSPNVKPWSRETASQLLVARKELLASPSLAAPRRPARVLGVRLPTFIAFGLSGLSVGGALASGFAAKRGNDPSTCDSRCTDHGVRQRALLMTTGVLTGVAAAGVGVGITLMLKAPKNPAKDAVRPRFDLGLSGKKAVAKVGWVFSSF